MTIASPAWPPWLPCTAVVPFASDGEERIPAECKAGHTAVDSISPGSHIVVNVDVKPLHEQARGQSLTF